MISLNKKQLIIIILAGVVVVSVIGYYIYTKVNNNQNYEQLDIISQDEETENDKNVENDTEEIVVHIAGEVKNPGIVKIKEGARIADVIEEAGGLTDNASITNVNLAYVIEDGQKIVIPSKEEQEETQEYVTEEAGEAINSESKNTETQTTTKININKATKEELQTLPGIGESTAQKIIDYREENGDFKQIEDLKNVSGIGDAKYEKIKDSIKVK